MSEDTDRVDGALVPMELAITYPAGLVRQWSEVLRTTHAALMDMGLTLTAGRLTGIILSLEKPLES